MAPKRKINNNEEVLTKKRGRASSSKKDEVVPTKKRGRPASNKNSSNRNLSLPTIDAMQTRSSTNGGLAANPAIKSVETGRVTGKTKAALTDSNVPQKSKKSKKSKGAEPKTKINHVGKGSKNTNATEVSSERRGSQVSINIAADPDNSANADEEENEESDGPSYWLMKAEPESRIEKGKDVKFSIDDLEAASGPEAWDGKLLSN